jgi:hypothetical protein
MDAWTKRVVAVLIMHVAAAVAAEPAREAYRHSRSGLSFPDTIGPLARGAVHDYDSPEAGRSIRYGGPGEVKADIYLYDNGLTNLHEGIDSKVVAEHFKDVEGAVARAEKTGAYRGVKLIAEGTNQIGSARRHLPALEARFEYATAADTGSEARCVSHLLLTVFRGEFLKIRFTYLKEAEAAGQATYQAFLTDMGDTVLFPQRSSDSDRSYVFKALGYMEAEPLGDTGREAAAWALNFLIAAEDISVPLEGGKLLEPLLDAQYRYGPLLMAHFVIANGAFVIQSGGKADDPVQRSTYALLRCLKVYNQILAQRPGDVCAYFDQLGKMDAKGLKAYVARCLAAAPKSSP